MCQSCFKHLVHLKVSGRGLSSAAQHLLGKHEVEFDFQYKKKQNKNHLYSIKVSALGPDNLCHKRLLHTELQCILVNSGK